MYKYKYDKEFNENIGEIITGQINKLNEHTEIIRNVLNAEYINRNKKKFKLTDEILLLEIDKLFNGYCLSERNYFYIKKGQFSGSAFNIFIIIFTLNNITSRVNEAYSEHKKNITIPLIKLDDMILPFENDIQK